MSVHHCGFINMLELKREEPLQSFKRKTSKAAFLRIGMKRSYAVSEKAVLMGRYLLVQKKSIGFNHIYRATTVSIYLLFVVSGINITVKLIYPYFLPPLTPKKRP